MIWKLAALWLVIGAAILLLVVPTETVTVKFELPPETATAHVQPPPSEAQVRTTSAYVVGVTRALLIAIPLGLGAWLTRRIVTRDRARKAP